MARLRLDVETTGAAAAAGELRGVGDAVDGVDRSARRGGGGLGRLGSALKVGIAGAALAAGTAVIKFGADALQAGSDAEQSLGAIESVFGANSKQVDEWARNSADRLGLSANSYREMAAITGAQLQGLGFSLGESTTKTDQLAQRAADMAATFGGTTKDAIDAVGAALRGERDPIERYGVSIKQTDINARLAAQGQSHLTGAARTTAEAQAALDIIMAKTARTQGTFARESDTAAGAAARLKANSDNLKTAVGSALTPALARVTGAAAKLVSGFNSGTGAGGKIRASMLSLGATLRGALAPAMAAVKGATDRVRAALAANPQVAAALARGFQNLKAVGSALAGAMGGQLAVSIRVIGAVISGAIGFVGGLISAFNSVRGAVQSAASAVSSAVARIRGALSSLPGAGLLSKVLGFSGAPAARRVMGTGAQLAGRTALAAARAAVPARSSSAAARTYAAAVTPTVIQITGALDPDAVARQVESLLRRRGARTGMATAGAVARLG